MTGDPEGTPNPLNPNPGMQSGSAMSTGTTSGTTPMQPASFAQPSTQPVGGHNNYSATSRQANVAQPSSYATAVQPNFRTARPVSRAAMPVMPSAPARPMNTRPVMDPMMRPRQATNIPVEHVQETASFESLTEEYDPSYDEMEMGNTNVPSAANPAVDSRYVAKDSIVEPKHKKKRWPIVTAIILLCIAIACGVAALIIFLMPKPDDRVATAISKLLNNGLPSIVKTDGELNFVYNGSDSAVSLINVDFDLTADSKTGMNDTSATVNVTMSDETTFSFDVDEVRMKDGDTFFKVDNVADILSMFNTGEVECAGGATACDGTDESLSDMTGVFDTIDDQWIKVGDDFVNDVDGLGIFDNQTTCMIGAFSDITKYGKEISNKYEANPFITYSTDNLGIAKKHNTLYRLGFDTDKLTAFVNSMENSGFVNALNSCAKNGATNGVATTDSIEDLFSSYPTMYAEVDNDYRFTRVYFDADTSDGSTNIRADLDFSYPATMEVYAPDNYINLNDYLSTTFNNFFDGNVTIEETDVEAE